MRVALCTFLACCALSCSGAQHPPERVAPVASAAPVAAAQPKVDGNQRLSAEVEPRRYSLSFTIDPTQDRFSARTVIELAIREPTRFVHLHARGLDIESVRVQSGERSLTPTLLQGENGGIALDLGAKVEGAVALDFVHSAALDEVPMSLYRARDGDDWYAFTQFEALAAREAFPCFDEPRFKTPFTIDITVPKDSIAVSNAPLRVREERGAQATYRFRTTRPLPTYLVALAVGRFDVVSAESKSMDGVPLRILTTHGKSEHTRFALAETPRILQSLVSYFEMPYPYQKLDLLAVPSFRAGAMENAGLVTYRERFLVLDPEQVSADDKLTSQSIIAHELAHMWFGDLVTMQWWDDLWLNEAFATWMSSRVMQNLSPGAQPRLLAVRDKVRVMEQDALASSTPIRKTIRDDGDIRNAFDPITYKKGQAVLGMLESWTGERPFREGIRRYLSLHRWKNATTFDLFRALDEATHEPVSEVGTRFVEQAGAPLVEVDWSCEDDHVSLVAKQSRYHASWLRTAASEPWTIPICIRWAGSKRSGRACFLLREAEGQRTLQTGGCPDYLHPNADEAGYYRWALPGAKLVELAGKELMKLSPAERIALPSHAQALLEAGQIDGARYVDLLTSVARDDHWLTVQAVASNLSSLARWASRRVSAKKLAQWGQSLLGPHARRVGFDPKKGEPESYALLREPLFYALVEVGADSKLVERSKRDARHFVADPNAPAARALGLELTIAARYGDAELHEGLVKALGLIRAPAVREYVVRALGQFRTPRLLVKSYQLLLSGPLRAQDFWVVTRSARLDDETQATLWAWYLDNEARLIELLGARMSADLPWLLAGFCDEEALSNALGHFEPIERFAPGAQQNLDQAVETATRCIELEKRHAPEIAKRLEELFPR